MNCRKSLHVAMSMTKSQVSIYKGYISQKVARVRRIRIALKFPNHMTNKKLGWLGIQYGTHIMLIYMHGHKIS